MDVTERAPGPGTGGEKEHLAAAREEMRAPSRPGAKALGTLAILAVLYTLYFASSILLPFVLAIVLYLLLSPLMRILTKRAHLPRALAALLLILGLFVLVGGVGAAVSVPASYWIGQAPQALPKLEQKLSFLQEPINYAQQGYQKLNTLMGGAPPDEHGPSGGAPSVSSLTSFGGSVLSGVKTMLGDGFTILLLLFFFLSAGDSLLRRLVEVLPTLEDKKRAVEIASEIEENVAGYLATITMMNVLVGVLNGLSVWLLGMSDPLLFGTIAFLLNYVPIIGPMTGVVLFFAVGIFAFSNPLFAFVPAGIYLAIHVLEGETITPMLLARRLTLNPVLVIVSLFFWDWLWGVPGALLSVPLLAVAKIVCDRLPGLHAVGHMLGADKPHGEMG
ncbi:AI-2E family transporter [Acidisphaera sp. L21]|uniref:AI-2E family transporter n=1 Tax=Acidisphaera sp. L21 TaxID=1641851 RepID=UPI00131A6CDE|nr:AI-2E family transporter [Acidisphaera sp. L21]